MDARMEELYARATAEYSEIAIGGEEFAAYVQARLPDGALPDRIHAADLFLACGCARGEPRAIAALDQHIARLAPHLRRTTDSDARVADALQVVRTKLLVQGKIADYAGRGSLGGWLRATATRALLDLLDADARERPTEEPREDDRLLRTDPELDFIKQRYRPQFEEAFRAALATLSPDERTVLRMNVLDGLNIARIGALLGVHRATVARWIAEARERILDETRRGLAERLHAAPREVESMMGLLYSQLDGSLHRFLVATR
jgi:RNA polymerase sigma-70 factor, ECF subfamily